MIYAKYKVITQVDGMPEIVETNGMFDNLNTFRRIFPKAALIGYGEADDTGMLSDSMIPVNEQFPKAAVDAVNLARKRAEDLKKEKISMNEMEYARVAASIEKELARVRVAKKHHSRHGIKID